MPSIVSRFRLPVILLAVLALAASSLAAAPLNVDRFGVAIKGYDPVAYFTDGQPVPGSSDIKFEWGGGLWYFASAENRDAFIDSPEKYAPRYGGYCAYAMTTGKMAPVDPEAWKMVDGKLYLNYSKKVQKKWFKDIPGHIAKADGHWEKLAAVKR